MLYESFCRELTDTLAAALPNRTLIRRTFPKNNGTSKDALVIHDEESFCLPVIYLDPMFRLRNEGLAIDEICRIALSAIAQDAPRAKMLADRLTDPEAMRERITFRLVSRKANPTLLQMVPWLPFLDLAVVFSVSVEQDALSQTTALIQKTQAERLGLSPKELFRLAKKNTPSMFPAKISPMPRIPGGLKGETIPALPGSAKLFVLTNSRGIYGASCVLYPDVLENFAQKEGCGLFVLPSSIHELLLLPDTHAADGAALSSAILRANEKIVPPEDRLSKKLYYYSRTHHALRKW